MKSFRIEFAVISVASRPARGAWVEIECLRRAWNAAKSRAPQGARGLKFLSVLWFYQVDIHRRAPQGARGLKSLVRHKAIRGRRSRPARGAWVEIHDLTSHSSISDVAPRKGRVG